MKKIIISALIIFLGTVFGAFEDGKYGGEFISYSVEARSLALGNMTLTSLNDASAAYWNPAYLPHLTKKNLVLSHSERFDGLLQQEFAGFNTKYNGNSFGIAFIRIGVDDIPITELDDENGSVSESNRPKVNKYVNDNEFALFLSYGKEYNDKLSLGGSVKLLGKTFEEESAYGIGFDVSMLYNMNENLVFAAKAQDITTSVLSWSTGNNEFIKPSILGQAEYRDYLEYYNLAYKVMGGTKLRFEGYEEHATVSAGPVDAVFMGGVELLFKDVVFLRGGYDSDNTWACGTGVKLYGFNLDYAFKPDYEDLGSSHKVSLSYSWE